ncbi:MAG: DNA replication and repair protein RecF [Oscillospiraceae bacterium]|nr:DNA replication and repair protein RecF [Oscillospiraceae bacterium]
MILKKIRVKNFRNIKAAELEFGSGVNVFYGDNAQGKTNLLEAAAIVLGKNFRNIRKNDIIPFDNDKALTEIDLFYENESVSSKLNQISYRADSEKSSLEINSIPIEKAKRLYGKYKYVTFIPDELEIIKGYPALRRTYLDNIAIMQNAVHRNFLSEYKYALKQRCAAYFERNPVMDKMLDIWDDILIKQGINLTYGRLKYLCLIEKYTPKIYRELSDGEELGICYFSDIYGEISSVDSNNKEKLYNMYKEKLRASALVGQSAQMPGAHRDDILFTINGNSARNYGSQGQLRSIAVSLKLAEAEIIREFNKENPVVLLDEVLSELDEKRRRFIIKHFVNSQVFITSCNVNDLINDIENIRIWSVNEGDFSLSSFGE